jgi:Uma2 family endonuclease
MSIATRSSAIGPSFSPLNPALEPGDRLTRDEFERRYDAMPELKKAELIDGVVYMPPAVRWGNHATPHADLIACLVFYRVSTPGVTVGDNASTRLDLDNGPQPDATMVLDRALGGKTSITEDDYIEGAPEFVAEVAASCVSIDLNQKFRVYRRGGVGEYLVWRVQDRAIDLFALRDGEYKTLPLHSDGTIRSEIFPGLWIHADALICGDMVRVLQFLQEGLASPEHAEYVALLRSRVTPIPET